MQLTQTLIVRLLKTHFVHGSLIVKSQQKRIELVTRPGVQCQMDIDVGSIIFSHHHLFSLEHYLANKLVEKYNIYQTAKLQQASASLDKRLAILYRAVDELQAKKTTHKSDEEKEFQVYSTYSNILVQKHSHQSIQEFIHN